MYRHCKIFASSFHCKKCKSIIFFRVQLFIWTASCTTLESYFELLCTSLSLVRPPGKIPPSANYTLLCSGIMTLNHNEQNNECNMLWNYNDKISVALSWNFSLESIHNRTNVYEPDVISASPGSVCAPYTPVLHTLAHPAHSDHYWHPILLSSGFCSV